MKISKTIYPNLTSEFFEIIKNLKTPCVCYDFNFLVNTVLNFKKDLSLFKNSELYFAVKANNNLSILQILKNLGLGVDVSSYEEYITVKKVGFNNVSITTPAIDKFHLKEISKHHIFDIDNIDQIEYIENDNIGVRINLKNSVYRNFGISIEDEYNLDYIKKKNKIITRIHFHANNFTLEDFIYRLELSRKLIKKHPTIKEINMGGDLLTLYNDRKNFLKTLLKLNNDRILKNIKIIFEPGDALLKYSGFLVTSIISSKIIDNNNILFVDSSSWVSSPWNNINPIIFDSTNQIKYTILGNTMYPGDIFGTFLLDIKNKEDVLIFPGYGSYTISNFRNFHLYKKYKEYLIKHNNILEI